MPQDNPTVPPLPAPTNSGDGASELSSKLMESLSGKPSPQPPAQPESAPPAQTSQPAQPPVKNPEPSKPASQQTTAPKPVSQQPAKPAAPAPQKSQKTTENAVDFNDPKLTAPELRKRLTELTTLHSKTLAEKDTALNQVQSRLKELEAKKYWTEDDEKKFKELSEGKSNLEAQLYARDYAQSPEYKKNFQDKIDEQFNEALEIFSALSVQYDQDGEVVTRPANQQDLLRLYRIPNLAERKKMAKTMFGDEYQEALDAVAPMISTNKAAQQAIKEKQEAYNLERQQAENSYKEIGLQFQKFVADSFQSLQQSEPEIFGQSEEDKDGSEALMRGLKFVDESANNAPQMSINERAARSSLIRAMAAAHPRMKLMVSKLKEENENLRAQLAAFQGSDPGNAGEHGGQPAAVEDTGGVESMAAKFDKLT